MEPSAGLRQLALATHPELSRRVQDGFLPGGLPPEIPEKHDGILLSAVIMHIPDAELFDTAFSLRERLTRGREAPGLYARGPRRRPLGFRP